MSKKAGTQQLKSDFISELSRSKRHIVALLILFILPIILYNATVLGGKRYMGHDTLQWRAGAESIIQYRQKTGVEPLWATNMFSGMPAYVVSVEKAVKNIDTLLFGISRSIFPAMHYWILLLGLYVFFLIQDIRPLAASLGSVIIGFTTYIPIIIGAGHNTKFAAFVFVPWLFVGYWMLTRSKWRLLSFFVFTFAATLEFRAGHPQMTYYFFYLLGFWWIYDGIRAYQTNELKKWGINTGFLALAGVVAIISNLQPYWSMMEYTPFSTRGGSAIAQNGGGGLNLEYAFSWSQGWGELLTLIIPGLFGGASSQGTYWGPKPGTSGPHYLGAIAFVLVLFGIILYKKRRKYLFLGVGVLTMLFSLGYHFRLLNELMFRYVPYFNKFRTPEMWLIVTVFCFGVLAVYGLNEIFALTENSLKKRSKQDLKPLYMPLGIAVGLGLIFALGSGSLLSFEKPGEMQQIAQQVAQQNNVSPSNPQVQQRVRQYINTRIKPERKAKAKSDSIRYFVLVLLASGLILGFYKQKIGPGYFLLGLIILASYDMLSVDNRYMNEGALAPERIDLADQIKQQERPQDQFIVKQNANHEAYPWRVFPLDQNPFNNAIPCYFYPSIGGYTGAKISYYQDMVDELLFTGNYGINTQVLDMLNVKYITAHRSLPIPGLKSVFNQQGGQVYENTTVLPKAFFVDTVQTVTTPHDAVDLMKPQQGFDASHKAIVESDQPLQVQSDSTAGVRVSNYGPRNISLSSQSSKKGFMVLSEIYYPPGWTATVDGEPTEIYKTNYILRGIEVPAGKHEIKFSFNPRSYVWGARLAWVGSIFQWILGLIAIGFYYKERKGQQADETT